MYYIIRIYTVYIKSPKAQLIWYLCEFYYMFSDVVSLDTSWTWPSRGVISPSVRMATKCTPSWLLFCWIRRDSGTGWVFIFNTFFLPLSSLSESLESPLTPLTPVVIFRLALLHWLLWVFSSLLHCWLPQFYWWYPQKLAIECIESHLFKHNYDAFLQKITFWISPKHSLPPIFRFKGWWHPFLMVATKSLHWSFISFATKKCGFAHQTKFCIANCCFIYCILKFQSLIINKLLLVTLSHLTTASVTAC